MLKKIVLLSTFSIFIAACGSDKATTDATANNTNETTKTQEATKPASQATTNFDMKAEVEGLKKITKAFGGALKAELGAAMKEGGPLKALGVCSEKAMPITAKMAKENNVQISRVSLKNRNPSNVPNEWQTKILQDFDKKAAAGEDIAKMGHAEVIEKDGKKQLHFMKALPTAKVCLKCHGSDLSKEVTAKLAELYPNDKAIGYSENQVRGAIVIVKDIQ